MSERLREAVTALFGDVVDAATLRLLQDRAGDAMTVAEAAELLDMKPGTFGYHVRSGAIPSIEAGGLTYVLRRDVDRFTEAWRAGKTGRTERNAKIASAMEAGLPMAEVARRFGVSPSTVRVVWLEHQVASATS